jgi:hypothetical protein
MALNLEELNPFKDKLMTRDGHIVLDWFIIDNPNNTFFPFRALVKLNKRDVEAMPYTRSGRRYINVESPWDLVLAGDIRERNKALKPMRKEPWPYDCMPEPLRAIVAVKARDMQGVRSANKEWGMKVEDKTPIVTPISIETML